MPYSVLTETDLLARADNEASCDEDRLATALTAMEEQGHLLAVVDRPRQGETRYVFHSGETARRLNNVR